VLLEDGPLAGITARAVVVPRENDQGRLPPARAGDRAGSPTTTRPLAAPDRSRAAQRSAASWRRGSPSERRDRRRTARASTSAPTSSLQHLAAHLAVGAGPLPRDGLRARYSPSARVIPSRGLLQSAPATASAGVCRPGAPSVHRTPDRRVLRVEIVAANLSTRPCAGRSASRRGPPLAPAGARCARLCDQLCLGGEVIVRTPPRRG